MAMSSETNILFVPYRPLYSSKQRSSDSSTISQQKHAAREYHRKAKSQRLATIAGTIHKRTHHASFDINVDQSTTSTPSHPTSLLRNTCLTRSKFDEPDTIESLGASQLDPFHVCIPEGVPNYVLEILDPGKSG